MITSIIIQGIPRTGTTVMLDLFRHSSWIGNVYPENPGPEGLADLPGSWVWKRPVHCLESERLRDLCPFAAFIFMTRNLRDCLVSWHYYPEPKKNLLMPPGYNGVKGYIKLWKDYMQWVNIHASCYGKVIRLEDLILKKDETARSILAWLNIPYEQGIKDFVRDYISNEKVDGYPYGARSSPAKKVNGWKDEPAIMARYSGDLDHVDNAHTAETA